MVRDEALSDTNIPIGIDWLTRLIRQASDEAAKPETSERDRLVLTNLKLAVKFARQCGTREQFEDFFQIASIALMRAADSYHKNFGAKFSTYASVAIIRRLIAARKKAKLIPDPPTLSEKRSTIKRAAWDFYAQAGRMPDLWELENATGCERDEIEKALSKGKLSFLSLDETTEDSDQDYYALVPDENAILPDNEAIGSEDQEFETAELLPKLAAMETLSERDKRMFVLYCKGKMAGKCSLRKLGIDFGVTGERVRQVVSRVAKRLYTVNPAFLTGLPEKA